MIDEWKTTLRPFSPKTKNILVAEPVARCGRVRRHLGRLVVIAIDSRRSRPSERGQPRTIDGEGRNRRRERLSARAASSTGRRTQPVLFNMCGLDQDELIVVYAESIDEILDG